VTGAVTQGGQPVAGALVMFIPEAGVPSGGKTDQAGRFELRFNDGRPGAVIGKHKVSVTAGADVPPPEGGQAEPPAPAPAVEFHTEVEVTSSGPNDFAFEVQK
jgi:hypothetical protein